MEKNRLGAGLEKDFPAGLLLLCGFLAGTIIPNLAYRMELKQMAAASVYLLGVCSFGTASGGGYLLQVLLERGGFGFLCLLGGLTVFGVPMAVLTLFFSGLWLGALLAVSILQFGLAGGAVGLGLLFPQYLLYLPAILKLMTAVYRQSGRLWKNHGIPGREAGTYLRECFLPLLLGAAGILLEVWANPWILEKILKLLKFS